MTAAAEAYVGSDVDSNAMSGSGLGVLVNNLICGALDSA